MLGACLIAHPDSTHFTQDSTHFTQDSTFEMPSNVC